MFRSTRWMRAAGLLALAAPACVDTPDPESWTGTGVLALEGATVFTSPRVPPLEDGVVLVVDGLVEAVGPRGQVPIPPSAVRFDATGLFLLPGFWNARVRVDEALLAAAGGPAEELQALLEARFQRFGFTSIVETGTPREALSLLIERIQSGEVAGPRIVATGGGGVVGVHWAGASELVAPEGSLLPLVGADEAVVPSLRTLQVEASEGTLTGPDPMGTALERVRTFVEAGGALVFGTGAGFVPAYDPLPDLLLLEEEGLPFAVRLAALTTEPALRFGFAYVGEIEPGMVADLVLLDADPEVDAMGFGEVRLVLREGRPLFLR